MSGWDGPELGTLAPAQLVAGLLEESGQRVRQVIAAEQAEGLRRVNDTARQLSATTRDLVAFTQGRPPASGALSKCEAIAKGRGDCLYLWTSPTGCGMAEC